MEVIEKTVDYNEISNIESLCMQCKENGETRIMVMKLPFFKDIIVMSFNCDKCGFKNNEIQSNAQLQDKGIKYTFKVSKKEDLERLVVAGIRSLIYLPELDFEAPNINKGLVSTISGVIRMFRKDLEMNQDFRKEKEPENYEKIQKFCEKLKKLEKGDESVLPYHFVLDDASGNSYISNPVAPLPDVQLKEERYVQTKEQLYRLGYVSDVDMAQDKEAQQKYDNIVNDYKNADFKKKKERGLTDKEVSEIMTKMQGFNKKKDAHQLDYSKPITEQDIDKGACEMEVECFACGKLGKMRTCCCQLPFFKEITLMAFTCEHCGYKDSEVKTSGEVSDKGKKIVLKLESKEDFDRDVFKSDTCEIIIPELGFSLNPGTLGCFYSTIEGVMNKIYENLCEKNPFVGDSTEDGQKQKFEKFIQTFDKYRKREVLPFTLIIDDPLDNCFILNPYYPKEDPRVEVNEYERTEQQNEDLVQINLHIKDMTRYVEKQIQIQKNI